MADLGKTVITLCAKLVEYQTKKVLGEGPVSILAGGITELLGEGFKERIDQYLDEGGEAKKIIKAFEIADHEFVVKCTDEDVRYKTSGLAISKKLRNLAADLPDSLDAESLRAAIHAQMENDWRGVLSIPQLKYASELYFECLETALAAQSGQILQVILLNVKENTKLSKEIRKVIDDVLERIKKQSSGSKYWGKETEDRVNRLISRDLKCFAGREAEKRQLNDFIHDNVSGMMIITAGAGFGKSALLANWIHDLEREDIDIAFHFFSSQTDSSLEKAYLSILRQVTNFSIRQLR